MSFQEQDRLRIENDYPHEWIKPAMVATVFRPGYYQSFGKLFGPLITELDARGNKLIYPYYPQEEGFETNAFGEIKRWRRYKEDREYLSECPDIIITTASLGEPVRESLLLQAKRKYQLERRPEKVITFVYIPERDFKESLNFFESFADKSIEEAREYRFNGLPDTAAEELWLQARRASPLAAFGRQIQAQTLCFDVVGVVCDEDNRRINSLIHWDLAGGRTVIPVGDSLKGAAENIVLRLMTAWSAQEARNHEVLEETISSREWEELRQTIIPDFKETGRALAQYGFFIKPVDIRKLANIPLNNEIANLYSEGCFGWYRDGRILMTATGVREGGKPVNKGDLADEEVVVVKGAKATKDGVLIYRRPWEQERPAGEVIKPSSEALDIILMIESLSQRGERPRDVFLVHGHMTVVEYDKERVERLDLPRIYQDFPATCATTALAKAGAQGVATSEDPGFEKKKVKFMTLPRHGIWIIADTPERIIEYLKKEYLVLSPRDIPQGPYSFWEENGRCFLV